LPYVKGDPDVIAYDVATKRCIIAEVEAMSSGQPEQKLYKAVMQIVRLTSNAPPGWNSYLVVVVYGNRIADHLHDMHALLKLGICDLALADEAHEDRWLFGQPLKRET
jgi:hypothetical protein